VREWVFGVCRYVTLFDFPSIPSPTLGEVQLELNLTLSKDKTQGNAQDSPESSGAENYALLYLQGAVDK